MPEQLAVTTTPKRSKFAELLASIGDGTLEADASDQIVALVERLRQLGGKAKGTLTLKVTLAVDRGAFDVDADITVKEPKIVRPRTIMYVDPRGGLSRNNPQQIDAFSRDVSDERPVRDVPLAVSR